MTYKTLDLVNSDETKAVKNDSAKFLRILIYKLTQNFS